MATKDLVTQGCTWRIAQGHIVLVWKDPWLPNDDQGFVQSPIVEGLENLSVNRLIKENHTWDVDLIDSILLEVDKEKNSFIPLCS